MKRLLLIGGGPAHAEVLVALAQAATANAEVTVIHPRRQMPWTPLLPGLVAGHHAHEACHYDLAALARAAGAAFVEEPVVAFEADARMAVTGDGREWPFDFASLDVDASTLAADVPGVRQNALLTRPVHVFLEGWERVVELVAEGALKRLTFVGGEAGSVGLFLAMRERLRAQVAAERFAALGFCLVTPGARLCETGPHALSEALESVCLARGISLLRGSAVTEVAPDGVQLANGARLASDVTIWSQGRHAPRWMSASGIVCDEAGAVQVDPQLRSRSHPHVFAAGDCATGEGPAQPAQPALLAANLAAALAAQPLAAAVPTTDPPLWIDLGTREAVGVVAGRARLNWRWWWWRRMDQSSRKALARYRGG